ncbi:type II toxin-antitoxin system mRNA interferase toxin, RelE/StbE family [Candidatus Shapirobacteria bacterium]|nr:type II toxin-antitoxin system mRNA interferase toxin, RelE/StbE family [Candidatus Shapirobacteria bacterium]
MKDARVEFSQRFVKSLRKAPRKIQIAYRTRLELFLTDKYYPILNNHALTGKYREYRSINISGDWRAIFREFENGNVVYFDFLGTHSKLYK